MAKAAVFDAPGGPDVLHVAEVPEPQVKPGFIKIKVQAVSIEGGDTIWRRTLQGGKNYVVGYAAAGVVTEVGEGVKSFKKGDRTAAFWLNGSHAEYWVVPEGFALHVPDNLDIGIAAAIPVGPGTASFAVERLGHLVAPGKKVLVTGATGGVGNASIQLAKSKGAQVIAVGRSEDALKKLSKFGVTDYVLQDAGTPVHKQVLDKYGVVDAIVDNIGGDAILDAIQSLRPDGAVTLIGVLRGFDSALKLTDIMFKQWTIYGIYLGVGFDEPSAIEPAVKAVQVVLDDVAKGDVEVVISKKFQGLEQIKDAHAFTETSGSVGRSVVYLE